MPLFICRNDITTSDADVIVNAANPALAGIGPELPDRVGGVDGSIHRAAGIDLYRYCIALPLISGKVDNYPVRCMPGDCATTPGFGLDCKYIIHAVAPDYRSEKNIDRCLHLLDAMYDKIFYLFRRRGGYSIALPAIGVGSYLMPKRESSQIAILHANLFLKRNSEKKIFFHIIDADSRKYYAMGVS